MHDEKEAVELYNLGIGAREKGNISLAFDFFTRALEAHPGLINARVHLAVVANMLSLRNNHIHETAFYNAQAAARAKPNDLSYWLVYGEICLNQHKFPEAIAAYEKALTIDLDANKGFLWGLLGFAQVRWAKFDEARSSLEKAVELNPELGTPHFILSGLYYERYFDPARVAYHGERAFQAKIPCLDPIAAKWNSAHGYLITGDYIKGWDYFEARLSRNGTNLGMPLALERYPGKPLWRGEKGIRLLVQREMGLGDDFIMMRYFPTLRSRYGCDVQFECHPSMLEFVRQNFPDINCVAVGAVDPESFDMQIPIMSLPVVFRTRSYQVPGDGPYLHAEQARVEEWRARLPLKPGMLNVGVCWFSGRNSESADNHHTSKRKSLTFDQIKPLLDVPGAVQPSCRCRV